jgi:hypothetical protein
MEWIVVLFLTFNGQSGQVNWALTIDRNTCVLTGTAVAILLEAQTPGLTARFTCVERKSAAYRPDQAGLPVDVAWPVRA